MPLAFDLYFVFVGPTGLNILFFGPSKDVSYPNHVLPRKLFTVLPESIVKSFCVLRTL